MSTKWYYSRDGQDQKGPVSPAELKALADSGELLPTDMVWKEGLSKWSEASHVTGLFGQPKHKQETRPIPPPLPPPAPAVVATAATAVPVVQASLVLNCPHCQQVISLSPNLAGAPISCPVCHKQFQINGNQTRSAPAVSAVGNGPSRRGTWVGRRAIVATMFVLLAGTSVGGIALIRGKWTPGSTSGTAESTVAEPSRKAAEDLASMSEEQVRSILKQSLDSWVFRDFGEDFQRAHENIELRDPDFSETVILLKYEILGARRSSVDVKPTGTQGLGCFEVSTILTFQNQFGNGLSKNKNYIVSKYEKDKNWYFIVSSGVLGFQ